MFAAICLQLNCGDSGSVLTEAGQVSIETRSIFSVWFWALMMKVRRATQLRIPVLAILMVLLLAYIYTERERERARTERVDAMYITRV
mmetsp:Transcript_3875/g.7878  ORF Transcript_3875/g.7878 Transcript_3875/m.7878 type:complete len:88 (+) Transcript_3875:99-362(+)